MLGYITAIFACQLVGELLVAALGLPLPGPVAGMLVLLAGLMARGAIPAPLAAAGDFLLGNFALLFVPAGVGIMLHVGLLREEWLPITVALVASTLATVAVTALVMNWLAPSSGERETGS